MPAIDMMPRTCREAIIRRAWARRWVAIYLVAILGLIGSQWWVSSRNDDHRAELARLSAQVDANLRRNKERTRLLQEIEATQMIIARYNRIAWPVRVSGVVGSIAQSMPPSVSLTSFALTPRRINETRGRVPKGEPRPESKSYLVVEMEGVAPDDLELATFVSALESHGMFRRVTLDFARSSEVRGKPVRAFRLTTEVDLQLSYEFAQAPEGSP